MIEDGAFSHKIDYVKIFMMASTLISNYALKERKKSTDNQNIDIFTRIQRNDYCYLTELHFF